MPHLDLSDITLDDDKSPEATPPAQPTEKEQPETPPADTGVDAPEQPSSEAADKQETPPENTDPNDPPAPEEQPKDDSTDDKQQPQGGEAADSSKPTPFHQHPDWQKMQERVQNAEHRAAQAEQNLARFQPKPEGAGEFEGMSRAQIIEKIMTDKAAAGWKPKDQLDYDTAIEAAKDEASRIVSQNQQAANTAMQEQIDTKFAQLGVTSQEDKNKIVSQVLEWSKRGVRISIDSFDIVHEHLKLRGELGKADADSSVAHNKPTAAQPETSVNDTDQQPPAATQPTKTESQKKSQADANKKISKGKGGGGENKSDKPSFKYIRDTDLDDIILDQGSKLD